MDRGIHGFRLHTPAKMSQEQLNRLKHDRSLHSYEPKVRLPQILSAEFEHLKSLCHACRLLL